MIEKLFSFKVIFMNIDQSAEKFEIGDFVVYPAHGVGQVIGIGTPSFFLW